MSWSSAHSIIQLNYSLSIWYLNISILRHLYECESSHIHILVEVSIQSLHYSVDILDFNLAAKAQYLTESMSLDPFELPLSPQGVWVRSVDVGQIQLLAVNHTR